MSDQSLFLLFHRPVEAVVVPIDADVAIFDGMQKVHIEIACACPLQLFIEDAVAILFAVDLPGRKFIRKNETVTRISFYDRFSDRHFRLAVVIDISRVDIVQSRFHIQIDHLFHLFQIDLIINDRQTHAAEA